MFWSGTGSTEEFTSEYARIIAAFIARHQISTVVDLGCGDFQVAKRILGLTGFRYFGVDVVADLVSRNNEQFGNEDIRFLQADILWFPTVRAAQNITMH